MRALRLAAATAAVASLVGAASPPPTPRIEHAETLFGITIQDPYFWMENGGNAFGEWLAAQAAYTRSVLDHIPGRADLLQQIHRIRTGETWVGRTVFAGDRWFYTKVEPSGSVAKLFVRSRTGGEERVLVDPTAPSSGGSIGNIDYWSVSPDGHHVAYGVSVGGSEIGRLQILRAETGVDLPGDIDHTRYARPSWLDNSTFLYSRLEAPAIGGDQSLGAGRVFIHRLGNSSTDDVAVFGPGLIAGKEVPNDFFFHGLADPNSSMVVAEYDAGLTSSPRIIFVAPRASLGVGTWQQVSDFDDEVRGVVLHANILYLRTSRQRIVSTPAINPKLSAAETVMVEGAGTIDDMVAALDALYVQVGEGGKDRLVRIPWGGKAELLPLPFGGSISALTANPTANGVAFQLQNWTRSATVFAYDPVHRQFLDTEIAPPSPTSFQDIDSIEVRVRTADGQMVPLSIVGPRGTARDGRKPLLLYAYGAYSVALDPTFRPILRVLFDRGATVAVAHIRGGGGFGDDWHRAGQLQNKPNSIADFVAAADYLIQNGWASSRTLTAMGRSAGGIVVGNAVVERPELFSSALIDVGLLNTLRLERLPIGPFNTGEFGSTKTKEGVQMLYAIDAYQRLRDGVAYPGAIVSTGLNDSRIPPWMPAKFAARLQAANSGSRPVLLRVGEGGHSGGTLEQVEELVADYICFILWQAGIAEYQP